MCSCAASAPAASSVGPPALSGAPRSFRLFRLDAIIQLSTQFGALGPASASAPPPVDDAVLHVAASARRVAATTASGSLLLVDMGVDERLEAFIHG